ncbi:MAG: cyclodeaminase/cyclohydrolase family protein, partial [Candidatus Velthaea sp.]
MLDLQAYLNRLASAQPTPGGGSAATIVGALGAALVAMVARITLGNPKHADV